MRPDRSWLAHVATRPATRRDRPSAASRIIADRGEFVDALRSLLMGHWLVRVHDLAGGCVLDGRIVYRSFETLLQYGLIAQVEHPEGFAMVRYYRMTRQGRQFADRVVRTWRAMPWLERMAMRIAG